MHTLFGALLAILMLVPTLAPAADQSTATAASPPSPVATAGAPRKLDVNHATLPEFVGVPGIGPRMAQEILDLRQRKGSFSKLEDLLEIKGIGARKLAGLGAYLTVTHGAAPAAQVPAVPTR